MNDLTNFKTLALSFLMSCIILLPAHFKALALEKQRIDLIKLKALIKSTLIANMPDIVDCAVDYDEIASNSIGVVEIKGQSQNE